MNYDLMNYLDLIHYPDLMNHHNLINYRALIYYHDLMNYHNLMNILGLAEIMKALLVRYDNLFLTSFPYSMGWHGNYLLQSLNRFFSRG